MNAATPQRPTESKKQLSLTSCLSFRARRSAFRVFFSVADSDFEKVLKLTERKSL
jgi:hypothetical protein